MVRVVVLKKLDWGITMLKEQCVKEDNCYTYGVKMLEELGGRCCIKTLVELESSMHYNLQKMGPEG